MSKTARPPPPRPGVGETRAPRFLLCSAWAPWGPSRGVQQRLALVAEGLGRLGTVDVCTLNTWRSAELEEEWPAWVGDAEWCQVEATPAWKARAACGRASPVRHASLTAQSRRAAEARFFVRRYDVTWCVEPRGYEPVAALVSRPVVLDLHNVMSASLAHKRRLLARRPWLATTWRREDIPDPEYVPGLERRWRDWEASAVDACDRVVVCSELDRDRLGGRAAVVPNCYPRPTRPAGREARPSELRIGFVGLLDYPPNFDAVRWFSTAILPRIRHLEPNAEFAVVGQGGRRLHEIARRHGVRMLGRVDELAPHLAGLSVLVAPIRFGGGTRIKILEAFAHEIPAVATTIAAEGIEASDGDQLLLRDDPDGFARAVVALHRDAELRRRLVRSASDLYESRYTWEHGLASVAREVSALTARTRAGR